MDSNNKVCRFDIVRIGGVEFGERRTYGTYCLRYRYVLNCMLFSFNEDTNL